MISKINSIIHQNKVVSVFRIKNNSGAYVEVMNYGATILSVVVPDRNNKLENIILHYNNIESYFTDPFYLGCTVGRYANRISDAKFILDGKTYYLDKNDVENSNHGGFNGLNRKIFDYKVNEDNIVFSTESVDRESGFPGNLRLDVSYSFSDNNELNIEYKAMADKRTPVNFTNHAYFNLSGEKQSILNHLFKVNADYYLETDDSFLPTGNIYPLDNTAFDFRRAGEIGQMLQLKNEIIKGYNTYFGTKSNKSDMPLASVTDNYSGRSVDLYTSMPGFQFYTGDYLSGNFIPFEGLCIEAQYHPDGLNHSLFEKNILEPDIEKIDWIKYSFR
ncbi:aldose epimerase family protein [Prevotella sp. 10(H)]|uniref:aldose epimerase family protein n=1 Tax=Prevotella sp. 10(H) TaxID=1158294 RepID=UPI0012DE8E7E|nr:aldose epimerase family protein [Prevotella sp. 10(H)]